MINNFLRSIYNTKRRKQFGCTHWLALTAWLELYMYVYCYCVWHHCCVKLNLKAIESCFSSMQTKRTIVSIICIYIYIYEVKNWRLCRNNYFCLIINKYNMLSVMFEPICICIRIHQFNLYFEMLHWIGNIVICLAYHRIYMWNISCKVSIIYQHMAVWFLNDVAYCSHQATVILSGYMRFSKGLILGHTSGL